MTKKTDDLKSPTDNTTLEDLQYEADELLSKDITFFDHYRIKNLEEQDEKKTHEAQVNIKSQESKQQPKQAKSVRRDRLPDSKWLILIKWLTRLFLSLVFLIWIFILGIMVGRGSLWNTTIGNKTINGIEQILGFDNLPNQHRIPPKISLNIDEPNNSPPAITSQEVFPDPVTNDQTESSDLANQNIGDSYGQKEMEIDLSDPDKIEVNQVPTTTSALSDPPANLPEKPEPVVTAGEKTSSPQSKNENNDTYWPERPAGQGQFTVQVASAINEDEARRLVTRYRDKGFAAYYYKTNGGRYPVRINRYTTTEEAEAARQSLIEAGAKGPYISKLQD